MFTYQEHKRGMMEESWHYKRTCKYCGFTWFGLHCIHDGYQNPCLVCKEKPKPIKGECNCKFDDYEEDEEE